MRIFLTCWFLFIVIPLLWIGWRKFFEEVEEDDENW